MHALWRTFTAFLLPWPCAAVAAIPAPVHWTLTGFLAPAPTATSTLTLTAHIDPGWHLYALDEPPDGPIATDITLPDESPYPLLHIDESTPRIVPDVVFHQRTGLFTTRACFTLHLGAASPALPAAAHAVPVAPAPFRVQVRYQACSDRVCLPPRAETVTLTGTHAPEIR